MKLPAFALRIEPLASPLPPLRERFVPPARTGAAPSLRPFDDAFEPAPQSLTGFSRYLMDQGPGNACGTTAAAMIANYWKQTPNAYSHAQLDPTVRPLGALGSTPQSLADWFNQNGFRASAVNNATLDQLTAYVSRGVPVEVMIDRDGPSNMSSRFVDVVGVNGASDGSIASLRLADPASGTELTMSVDAFQKDWNDIRMRGQRTGYSNVMVVALPKDNVTVAGADGHALDSNDLVLPRPGGFGTRSTLIDVVDDGLNALGSAWKKIKSSF
jgi:hypothetical protein